MGAALTSNIGADLPHIIGAELSRRGVPVFWVGLQKTAGFPDCVDVIAGLQDGRQARFTVTDLPQARTDDPVLVTLIDEIERWGRPMWPVDPRAPKGAE